MNLIHVPLYNPPPRRPNQSPQSTTMLRHVEDGVAIAGSAVDGVDGVVHAVDVVAEEPREADTQTRMVSCCQQS